MVEELGAATRLRYGVTLADVQALSLHVAMGSEEVRRTRRTLRWALPLLMFGIFGAAALFTRETRYVLVAAVLAPLWALLVPRLYDRSVALSVGRTLAAGDAAGLLGAHELELTDDALVERTAQGEHRTRLGDGARIVTEGERTFVLAGTAPRGLAGTPARALVIPHGAVTEGDARAFVAALQQRLAAKGP